MSAITKVGDIYSYYDEKTMLEVANELEQQGYAVRRFRHGLSFRVEVTGYR